MEYSTAADDDGDFVTAAELLSSMVLDLMLARPIFGEVTPHLLQQATGSCIHDSSNVSRDHSTAEPPAFGRYQEWNKKRTISFVYVVFVLSLSLCLHVFTSL